MLGAHLSTAGGLHNALIEAERLRMGTVQVFTRNQRQWEPSPLSDDEISLWISHLDRLGWTQITSHASYLINLGSPEDDKWEKSIEAMIREVQRCDVLRIPIAVVHPGSHRGEGEKWGIKRVGAALTEVISRTPGSGCRICLETTAGSGNLLGGRFEHLAGIRQAVGSRKRGRIGTCFDTCHVSAAGYDMSRPGLADEVIRRYDDVIGLDTLGCFHLNDSKEPIGSRRDRHEHIGEGYVGKAAFCAIMADRRFRDVPKILETPKGETEKGTPWDTVNIRRLRRMQRS
ncbi:MAG: deoxyribonuclease IV [Planctomycetes bacterium]|nr:deoxyribonuclease IV [Planctomycetota bacterium]NOG54574.1 deoxyribonuclease IV [Planctomycetota bacterium]